jgi:hypothetical protein
MISGCLAIAAALSLVAARYEIRADDKSSGEPVAHPTMALQVHFADDTYLKIVPRDEKVTYVTKYGKLIIPLSDVRRLDLGRRVSDDEAKKIAAAISKLGSEDFKEREKANEELLAFGTRAYPELVTAGQSEDAEVGRRARELVDKIKTRLSPDDPELRNYDTIWTLESKIVGHADGDTLQCRAVFGDIKLRLAEVRSFRTEVLPEREAPPGNAAPGPADLQAFAGKFGTKLTFTVTGNVQGAVYGSDVYTVDSTLATAAVHAGALKDGQTGTVHVEIVQSPQGFDSTTKNGVTSFAWGAYPPGSYKFITTTASVPAFMPHKGNLAARLIDGSMIELKLRDEKISIMTDKGQVAVPVADIHKLSLASRTSDELAATIKSAVKKLGSDNVKERDAAMTELLVLGARAYPALVTAAKEGEAEVRIRAENLLSRLKETLPAEVLAVRDTDIIWTKDSKLTGKLESKMIRVSSPHLGDLELPISDIHNLRSADFVDPDKKPSEK